MLVYGSFFIVLYGLGVDLYFIILLCCLEFNLGFWVLGGRDEFELEE